MIIVIFTILQCLVVLDYFTLQYNDGKNGAYLQKQ